MDELICNGWKDEYSSGWDAYLVGYGPTDGAWKEYDRGWWDHYAEGY